LVNIAQSQVTVATHCPRKCEPGMVMHAIPKPGSLRRIAVSRCLQCLTYWETDHEGRIVTMRRGTDRELPLLSEGEVPEEMKPHLSL